ncbi:nitroreductase family protein [Allobranchiibius sp. CTAmp26]|uniref:nitroreductase family protein n=1 Tax=Allobranchiibius sp. CTAmp26 TaxID=2815214 RepID=UPI001AA0FB8F|nr:nitroreductase family protein [Allobranchiibius sp. CTAmp26]MBO1755277.1 nitroreductase family protein [Allobranchiibius sp. CTAmp26]
MSDFPRSPLDPLELLTTTRAVRKRLDLTRPVPLDLIKQCLTIALQGPSGSNRQHWHWVVVTDPAQKSAIGDLYRRAVQQYAASAGFAGNLAEDDTERSRVQHRVGDSVLHLGEVLRDVPAMLIPCIDTGGPLPEGNQADIWGSVLPAAWSFMLAARAHGLGTAWTTLHLDYEREVADILGLPDGVHQAMLTPIAYYTGTSFQPAPREPVDDVLHVDRW